MDCKSTMTMVDALADWVAAHQGEYPKTGVQMTLTMGHSNRPKKAAWLDFETPDTLARLIVWETGEADLEVGDVRTGQIAPAHKDLRSAQELDEWIMEVLGKLQRRDDELS